MKKPIRIKELVVGSLDYSAQGYFYMCMAHSYEYDQIKVKSRKFYQDVAEEIITLLKLNGWQESEGSGYQEKVERWKCEQCKTNYKEKTETCPKCKGVCKYNPSNNFVVLLEPIGALMAYREILLAKRDIAERLAVIQHDIQRQKMKDYLMLQRWGDK